MTPALFLLSVCCHGQKGFKTCIVGHRSSSHHWVLPVWQQAPGSQRFWSCSSRQSICHSKFQSGILCEGKHKVILKSTGLICHHVINLIWIFLVYSGCFSSGIHILEHLCCDIWWKRETRKRNIEKIYGKADIKYDRNPAGSGYQHYFNRKYKNQYVGT